LSRLIFFTKWILNLSLLAVILAIGTIAVTIWLAGDGGRHVPGLGRYKLISVLSDSMRPVMRAGDAIVVDARVAGRLQEGDIITFWRANNTSSLLTHRITAIKNANGERVYFTRGDANRVADGSPVPERDVVGRYMFCVPLGGYLIGFLHTRAGFALLVMLPVTLALLLEIKRIYPEAAAQLRWRGKKNDEFKRGF